MCAIHTMWHVVCFGICVLFYSSFVCLEVYAYVFKSKVHCGSALGPIPYPVTALLFFSFLLSFFFSLCRGPIRIGRELSVSGGLSVWRSGPCVNFGQIRLKFGSTKSLDWADSIQFFRQKLGMTSLNMNLGKQFGLGRLNPNFGTKIGWTRLNPFFGKKTGLGRGRQNFRQRWDETGSIRVVTKQWWTHDSHHVTPETVLGRRSKAYLV